MSYTQPTTISEAAKLLDQVHHEWWKKINCDILNMSASSKCILGQLYGEYGKGFDLLFNEDVTTVSKYTPFGSCADEEEWIKEIKSRLNPTKLLTFWEAMQLLTQDKKVRRVTWEKGRYWCMNHESRIRTQHGIEVSLPFGCCLLNDWEIYTPPLTFGELKAGEKFMLKSDNTICTKGDKETIAIYDGYKLITVSPDREVERVTL